MPSKVIENNTTLYTKTPVYKCVLVRDSSVTLSAPISSPQSAVAILAAYMEGLDRENLVVLFLDRKNRIIGLNTVSVGSVGSTEVCPANVFKPAIIANAASIMLAHNHPSGDPSPSPEDFKATELIKRVGKDLDIELLDHIVIGSEGRYVSFREKGLGGFR